MSSKIISAIVALACVGTIVAAPQYHHQEEEHHGPVQYDFHYDIHDDHTGDVHGRKETRHDHQTQGEYYLIDADGHKRTVTYHVDGKSGFIAQVHREPIKGHQAPQQVHKILAAPVHKILAVPAHHGHHY
ncbi:larval cuticle protein A2B-like [Toxorhynchites rutilus septentrionalis]|uniref:larval cuticle protein A2B-like n=1 Tax=Toxorhynchites rutilus septentrionalis TaxID=329112 RepID=UPI00247B2CC4|nr:larval cuticle protein A2B-like [Toxorhynchites rutilus septentrionalis]